jgi:hypothetical protein
MKFYDPDPVEIPNGALEAARKLGLQPVHVICLSRQEGEAAMSFVAFVQTVPRVGETVILEDTTKVVIKRVYWNLIKSDEQPPNFLIMMATAVAMRPPDEEQPDISFLDIPNAE